MTEPAMTLLPYTGDPEADAMLAREPLALIIGFILDQRVTIPKAFSGGLLLAGRTGGRLDAAAIAAMPTADLETLVRTPPGPPPIPERDGPTRQRMCAIVARDHGATPPHLGDARGRRGGGAAARVRCRASRRSRRAPSSASSCFAWPRPSPAGRRTARPSPRWWMSWRRDAACLPAQLVSAGH